MSKHLAGSTVSVFVCERVCVSECMPLLRFSVMSVGRRMVGCKHLD